MNLKIKRKEVKKEIRKYPYFGTGINSHKDKLYLLTSEGKGFSFDSGWCENEVTDLNEEFINPLKNGDIIEIGDN